MSGSHGWSHAEKYFAPSHRHTFLRVYLESCLKHMQPVIAKENEFAYLQFGVQALEGHIDTLAIARP